MPLSIQCHVYICLKALAPTLTYPKMATARNNGIFLSAFSFYPLFLLEIGKKYCASVCRILHAVPILHSNKKRPGFNHLSEDKIKVDLANIKLIFTACGSFRASFSEIAICVASYWTLLRANCKSTITNRGQKTIRALKRSKIEFQDGKGAPTHFFLLKIKAN